MRIFPHFPWRFFLSTGSPGTLTKASDDFYLHMDGMTMRFFCQALINVFFSDFKSNIDL